jgi:uncharacterized protein (TIGR03437 family)
MVAGAAVLAPAPNSVQNPGSNFLPGLPGYGSAQGSIIIVYGANLSGTTLVQAPSLPFQTTLNSTSIKVTVGATTVNLLMVYTINYQLAAILPSNTPVGNGTLTVTYNGQSGSTPIVVVGSALGLLTQNELGTGPASAQHADYTTITATSAAHPGDEIQIYGTGIGGLTGGASDASAPGAVQFSTANLSVYVGGTKLAASAIPYYGRNPSDPGLDQINIILPPNVTGCTVSLVIQNGTGASATVSNTVTLAIASAGSTCSDANGISAAGFANIQAALNSKQSVNLGFVSLQQSTLSFSIPALRPRIVPATTSASGFASFEKYTSAQFAASNSAFGISIGSCTISITNSAHQGSPITATGLDAGPQIAVMQPGGTTVNLTANTGVEKGYYSSPTSGGFSSIAPGTYHFTGPGGADVGAFAASLTVPTALTWTNQAAITAGPIVRGNPLTLTWTGGDPSSFIEIIGESVNTDLSDNSLGASFFCIAPVGPGSFTIPGAVTLSLPASAGVDSIGFLELGSESTPAPFTAQGLDYGFISAESSAGSSVTWQ